MGHFRSLANWARNSPPTMLPDPSACALRRSAELIPLLLLAVALCAAYVVPAKTVLLRRCPFALIPLVLRQFPPICSPV